MTGTENTMTDVQKVYKAVGETGYMSAHDLARVTGLSVEAVEAAIGRIVTGTLNELQKRAT